MCNPNCPAHSLLRESNCWQQPLQRAVNGTGLAPGKCFQPHFREVMQFETPKLVGHDPSKIPAPQFSTWVVQSNLLFLEFEISKKTRPIGTLRRTSGSKAVSSMRKQRSWASYSNGTTRWCTMMYHDVLWCTLMYHDMWFKHGVTTELAMLSGGSCRYGWRFWAIHWSVGMKHQNPYWILLSHILQDILERMHNWNSLNRSSSPPLFLADIKITK